MILCGCSGRNRTMLENVDAIMEEKADSALIILNGIDRNSLSNRDLPYYALLMTQAQVKNDISLDSDSLISIAYKKYDGSWRGDKGIRSNFYMGEVFFNQTKNREAMCYYLTAYEEAKRLDNDYWQAKAAERIADLFFIAFNYSESARYRKEAIKHFGKSGKMTNQRYAVVDLATDYMNVSHFEEALALLDSVYNIYYTENLTDSCLLNYITRGKVNALAYLERPEEINNDEFKSFDQTSSNTVRIDKEILNLRFPNLQNTSIAEDDILLSLKDKAQTDEDKVLVYYAIYQFYKSKNCSSIGFETVDSLIFYQNAIAQNVIRESVTTAERDFYLSIAKQEKERSQIYFIIIGLVSSIFILIFILIWRSYYFKSQIYRKEIESNLDSIMILKSDSHQLAIEKDQLNLRLNDYIRDITNLNHIIEEKEFVLGQLQEKVKEHQKNAVEFEEELNNLKINEKKYEVEQLFKEQWVTLNMLCDEYFELGDSEIGKRQILKSIERELKRISSKRSLQKIEEEVNKFLDNIMTRIRKECVFLNEKDFIFIMLIYAGFSVRAICLFTDIKYGNFYVKKSRLIKKISESNVRDKEEFIEKLS